MKKREILGEMLERAGVNPDKYLGEGMYKVPLKRKNLDEPTVANLKKRAKCVAKAVSFLEKAVDALGECPKVDFMSDIVDYSRDIEQIISRDGGGLGVLARAYAKEGKKESEKMMSARGFGRNIGF